MSNRSNTFLWKRSNVAGKVPINGDLLLGEMALNTADVKLYTSGTTSNSILPIGWDRVSRTGDTMTGTLFVPTLSATTIYGDGSNITGMTGTFGITVDGSGSVLTNGVKGFVVMPYNATIIGWDIIGNTTGDCMVDVWKSTGPSIPTIVNTITGTEKPRLNSQQINSDNTLTSWSTSLFTNDVVAFNVVSATTVSRINLIIKVIKN